MPNGFSLKDTKNIFILLTVLYTVGLFGFLFDISPYIVQLTPIQLIISLFFVLYFQKPWQLSIVIFCLICAIAGFLIEVAGVSTGNIFGNYSYGNVLGPKLYNTPFIIAVNWLLVTYTAGVTVNEYVDEKHGWRLKSFLAAVLMVGLDFFIEPTAMKTDMWHWQNNIVPFKNYIGWFIVSLIFQIFFQLLLGNTKNKIGVLVFILQFLFFGILFIFR